MADIQAVLQQLRDNKKKQAVAKAAVSTVPRIKKPRVRKIVSRSLGKVAGHCPHCQIEVGTAEVGESCSRCGTVLKDLLRNVDMFKLLEWRRHDKWGNAAIPAPATCDGNNGSYYMPNARHVL